MNIPNFIDMPVVDINTGMLTPEWKYILQQLISTLTTNASDSQGLVVPPQTSAQITTTQNSKTFDPVSMTNTGKFITPFGTLLYNSTSNILMVALDVAGAPVFTQIVTL